MDYILKNGIIVDGKKNRAYQGNLYIKDGLISKISKEDLGQSSRVLDISNKVLAPAFIDMHSHSDISYMMDYEALSKVYQGIGTEIVGNCGVSLIPTSKDRRKEMEDFYNNLLEIKLQKDQLDIENYKEYKEKLENCKLPLNIGVLIGHGSLRAMIVGFENREASKDELDLMCRILDRELKSGALGLSLGLIYPTGSFSSTEELISLARVLKNNNKILAVHMRNESDLIFEALEEMFHVVRESQVHLHISHLKLIGKRNWGKAKILLDKIKQKKAEGYKITCDQYPYTASSTYLSALVPNWAHAGGKKLMLDRLAKSNEQLDREILEEMESRGGAKRINISAIRGFSKELVGMTLYDIAKERNEELVKVIKELITASQGNVTAIYHALSPEDVLEIMSEVEIAIASDGYAYSLDKSITQSNPHPRNFGSFPKFLETVREKGIISLEEAIYKITKLPADILGIKNRGTIEIGKVADLVVFDYEEIKDNSTFENSVAKATGIEHLFVNGQATILFGKKQETNPGQVI